jgi:hypothetical protein
MFNLIKTKMKKNNIFSVLFAVFIVALASCTKETDMTTTQKDPTTGKILKFKDKIARPDKSAQTMSLDSAVWYVEAALNYSNCIISEENAQSGAVEAYKDSAFFKLEETNGTVGLENAADAYNSIQEQMIAKLNSLNYPVKFFTMADVEIQNGNYRALYEIRYKDNSEKIAIFPIPEYEASDDWEWGQNLGNCTHTVPTGDAAKEIYKRVYSNSTIYKGQYFTDVRSEGYWVCSIPGRDFTPFFSTHSNYKNLTNYGGYIFTDFYTGNLWWPPAWHYCISRNDINYLYAQHTEASLRVIESVAGNGRKISSWDLTGSFWIENYRDWGFVYHRLYACTGILHINGTQTE